MLSYHKNCNLWQRVHRSWFRPLFGCHIYTDTGPDSWNQTCRLTLIRVDHKRHKIGLCSEDHSHLIFSLWCYQPTWPVFFNISTSMMGPLIRRLDVPHYICPWPHTTVPWLVDQSIQALSLCFEIVAICKWKEVPRLAFWILDSFLTYSLSQVTLIVRVLHNGFTIVLSLKVHIHLIFLQPLSVWNSTSSMPNIKESCT